MTAEPSIAVRPMRREDRADLVGIYGRAFDEPYPAPAFDNLTETPGSWVLLAQDETKRSAIGFVIARCVLGEGEILSIAVDPAWQGQGAGRALLRAADAVLLGHSGETVFLEVAIDNAPARGLYRRAGFVEIGRRNGYYRRRGGLLVDALVLKKALRV